MKRILLPLLPLLASLLVPIRAAEIFVAPGGRDGNDGNEKRPLATLEAARDAARVAGAESRRIVLLPGDHFLERTLELDARDGGLTIEAAGDGPATVYGGAPLSGWRRDGERFWCADISGVKEGAWDFRAIVVNGRMPDRARLPESGSFLHRSTFDVRYLSNVGGGFERKATDEELTTMLYDPGDLPPTLEPRNAEVRVYHMWDESLCGVARNDTTRHALIFSTPAKCAPGAFGVKKYVVFNTREGMTRPGQWYLDRAAGRVVYWPLSGEDMSKAKVIVPRVERVIRIAGDARRAVERVTLRGFGIQATTTPLKSGGFGAYAFEGALAVERARGCRFERLGIANVGGQGVAARAIVDCEIVDCEVHHTGACGIKVEGSRGIVARNHVHHVGLSYPSAVALTVSNYRWRDGEPGFRVWRNEIHDAPYTGIIGSGGNHLIEENLICRVMREMQDGGAIYGGMARSILRGNIVRDVVKVGEGYGVSAYYLDEGARDCVVERNVSIGVERPSHNHIARDLIIRDNVFIAEKDMALSFQRSAGCVFENNTLYVPGKLSVTPPSAIKSWARNVIFHDGLDKDGKPKAFAIDDAMPTSPAPARRTTPVTAERLGRAPALDGEIGWDEWPRAMLHLDRQPLRWSAPGAPAHARVAYDDSCLYVSVNVTTFDVSKLRADSGSWGVDDGAEVCVEGKTPEGKRVTYVIHGFIDGRTESVTLAGAPADAAARLAKAIRYAAGRYGKASGGWRAEWAMPWETLGLKPVAGAKIPFNIGIYRAEDRVWRCLEGTGAQNWRLDEAAVLQLK